MCRGWKGGLQCGVVSHHSNGAVWCKLASCEAAWRQQRAHCTAPLRIFEAPQTMLSRMAVTLPQQKRKRLLACSPIGHFESAEAQQEADE